MEWRMSSWVWVYSSVEFNKFNKKRNVVQMVLCLLLFTTLMKNWRWDLVWMKCLSSWDWLLRGANFVKNGQNIIIYLQWLQQRYVTIVTNLDLQIKIQAIIARHWKDGLIIFLQGYPVVNCHHLTTLSYNQRQNFWYGATSVFGWCVLQDLKHLNLDPLWQKDKPT